MRIDIVPLAGRRQAGQDGCSVAAAGIANKKAVRLAERFGGDERERVRLVYNGDGNGVEKTVNGVTTRYLVDDLNPTGYAQVVAETVNGAPQRTHAYGLQRISENQVVNNTWTPTF